MADGLSAASALLSPAHGFGGIVAGFGQVSAQNSHGRHEQCRRNALAGNIAEEEGQPAIGQREVVVKITGNLAGWQHAGKDFIAQVGIRWDRFRQETLLDFVPGQGQFLTQPFLAPQLGVQGGVFEHETNLQAHNGQQLQVVGHGGRPGVNRSAESRRTGRPSCPISGTQSSEWASRDVMVVLALKRASD